MPLHRSRALIALGAVSLVALAVVMALAAATTRDAAAATATASATLRLSADADGDLRFDKKSLSATAGRVTIRMRNPSGSGLDHGIAITGKGVDRSAGGVAPGRTARVSATLKAGRYTFFCPVGNHRSAGMRGALRISR
jgi:uncharacterized cupredoxin-like copper-binding protein